MNRRTFSKLVGLTAIGSLAEGTEASTQSDLAHAAPPVYSGQEVVLEDDALLVAFDKRSGAITRFERKSTQWTIQRRPELGLSFRLLVPMPHRRANFVRGEQQSAQNVEKISNTQVRILWRNLLSEHGGVLPLTFEATVTLEGGILTFDATLTNNSDLTVETVDYPYLGDLSAPAPDEPMRAEHMWYANLDGGDLHPYFRNDKGYWGVDFPTQTIESKQSNFCLIQCAHQGLYVEMGDPTLPYLLEFTFEQHPGYTQSVSDLVPSTNTISGLTVNLHFRTCHFVFAAPKSTTKLLPIVMQTYNGDWHDGVDVYKQRRAIWFKQPHIADWVKDVHSWLQLQVDGAEQDFTIPYSKLRPYIDDCVNNGVTAIQLVGWNLGGQDGGDPSQDTDPGLGTWQELHDAVAYARTKGVKMILFGKLYWADLTTEWYRQVWHKFAATDPFGIPYQTGGYSYTTPTQLAEINNRRRAILDVQDQTCRDLLTKEFQKILALGGAGWLFDEVCHHGPVEFSFSPDHGYRPPKYIYGGDMPLASQFRAAADKVDPDFIFAGEGPQDWLLQYYPVSYFRINNGSRAVCRYIDPQAPLVVAVTGFDDREKLNLILLNRYVISYEPLNFKGRLTDFPLTLAYGTKIDALRKRYKAWLWDSAFTDTRGATVTSDISDGAFRYSVFVGSGGKRTVIVINQDSQKEISAKVELPNQGTLLVATPEEPEVRPTSGTLSIPPRSAAVFMEQ